MGILSKEAVQAQLPKVVDVVYRVPNLHKSLGRCREDVRVRRGVVTHINEENLRYTVRFDCGYSESYKLPEAEEVEE